jgi:hypothetical protein
MAQRSFPWTLISWLLTAAVSVPLGWWVALPMAQPRSDLVWASLAFGPPWVALRLVAGDFRWNAFFFGFLPPVLAFEAVHGLGVDVRQAAQLVVLAPLLGYAIIGFANVMLFGGAGIARLAREALATDSDAGDLARRLGRRLGSAIASAVRWYAIWLGGAAIGFLLALAAQAIVRAAGIPSEALPLALLSRAIVGLVAGVLAWALLRLRGERGHQLAQDVDAG